MYLHVINNCYIYTDIISFQNHVGSEFHEHWNPNEERCSQKICHFPKTILLWHAVLEQPSGNVSSTLWRFSRYKRVLTQMPSQSKWQLYKGHILDHFQREKLSCVESFHKTAGLCFIMWPHFQGFCEYWFHEP